MDQFSFLARRERGPGTRRCESCGKLAAATKAAASFPRSCGIVGNPLWGFPQFHSSGSFHSVFASGSLTVVFHLISSLCYGNAAA